MKRKKKRSVVTIKKRVRVFIIVTFVFNLISGFMNVSALYKYKDYIYLRTILRIVFYMFISNHDHCNFGKEHWLSLLLSHYFL